MVEANPIQADFDFAEAGTDLGGLAAPNQTPDEDPYDTSITPFEICSISETLTRL